MITKLSFDLRGGGAIDKLLAELPENMRKKGLKKAMRGVVQVVRNRAKVLAPRGKKRSDKKNKQLYRTISGVVREYRRGKTLVAVIGPTWPQGAHGHLVEFGHRVVSHGKDTGKVARPNPFLVPSAQDVAPACQSLLENNLKDFVSTVRGNG